MEQTINDITLEDVILASPIEPALEPAPELSDKWICYLFGGNERAGFSYVPPKNYEPNICVRIMMRLCFDCRWVKKGE